MSNVKSLERKALELALDCFFTEDEKFDLMDYVSHEVDPNSDEGNEIIDMIYSYLYTKS